MKITIIVSDSAVYIDGCAYLDLIWGGTPADVHALQWKDIAGWVEYNNGTPNENIIELPQWALNAMDAWTFANNHPNID